MVVPTVPNQGQSPLFQVLNKYSIRSSLSLEEAKIKTGLMKEDLVLPLLQSLRPNQGASFYYVICLFRKLQPQL